MIDTILGHKSGARSRALPGLLTAAALLTGSPAKAQSDLPSPAVQQALNESTNGRFASAKKQLTAILSKETSSPRDREGAGVELARIEWRIDDQPEAARKRLEPLIAGAQKKVPPLLLLSRMERSLERYEAARTAARRAVEAAGTSAERDASSMSLALALVAESVAAARKGEAAAYDDASRARLSQALDLVAPRMRERPGPLTASQVQLDAALLLDDGPRALEAWLSYYAAAGAADSSLLAGPRARLSEILPLWKGPAATREDRLGLVQALADSRLFTEAVLIALDPRASDARLREIPWVKDVVLYESFIEEIRDRTDRYYRTVAQGKSDAKAWQKDVTARTEALWKALSWPAGAPPFDVQSLVGTPDTPLGARFGAVTKVGETREVTNLHMGHRVVDASRMVEQYGRRASIRFIVLDTIVSNGYESWMWDGRAAHGGWADKGLIVQVRPGYAENAQRAWQELNEPERRAKAEERRAEETARDDERAKKDPYAYLPGLLQRLRAQGTKQVLDGLRAKGIEEGAMRAAFVEAYDRAVIETSIFAHEGRHAIDAEFEKSMTDAELEYRAKLSQIAFAPVPRLAFDAILDTNIGDKTPHGQANLKLVKGLVAWMGAHREEIAGLAPEKPLLPQLDRLTDDQLRAAARSLDPMAARAAKSESAATAR